ncbi:MAG: PEGA domain-containing protein [Lachnospiraceae bacterium]|nr:PEGA domain-containing protein [Lachnospiraceae bacterium]
MKGKGPKSCKLKFEIDVKGAKIYLDGKSVKKDKTMTVLYGVHSLKVTADGYDDWERTLYVNSSKATISLDISDSKKGSSKSNSTSTSNSGTTNSTTNNSSSSTNSGNTSTDTNGSTVTTGNGSTSTDSSSGTKQSERNKAQEDYLSTLADSIVSTLGSGLSD